MASEGGWGGKGGKGRGDYFHFCGGREGRKIIRTLSGSKRGGEKSGEFLLWRASLRFGRKKGKGGLSRLTPIVGGRRGTESTNNVEH